MPVEILSPADYKTVAWSNGQGSTQEVFRYSHPFEESAFSWRISIATIETASAFSEFPGVDRIILPLTGGNIALSLAGAPYKELERLVPFAFAGEAAVACQLSGPAARDFNVMVRRQRYQAQVRVETWQPDAVWSVPRAEGTSASSWTVVYIHKGSARLDDDQAQVTAGHTIVTHGLVRPLRLTPLATATVILVNVEEKNSRQMS